MRRFLLRLAGVLLLALSLPVLNLAVAAADYSAAPEGTLLAQSPPTTPGMPGGPDTLRHPGDYCCIHCRWNEKPCGRGCMPASQKLCFAKTTCACSGKP